MESHGSFSHFWKIAFYFIFLLLITVSSRLIELAGLVTEVFGIELNFELGRIMAHFYWPACDKAAQSGKKCFIVGIAKRQNGGWISQKEKSVLKKS